jgi:hypothetical protein
MSKVVLLLSNFEIVRRTRSGLLGDFPKRLYPNPRLPAPSKVARTAKIQGKARFFQVVANETAIGTVKTIVKVPTIK